MLGKYFFVPVNFVLVLVVSAYGGDRSTTAAIATPTYTATSTNTFTPSPTSTPALAECSQFSFGVVDDARLSPYNFTATVTDRSGEVYNLEYVQTLSEFPFPGGTEHIGKYMIMFWLPETGDLMGQPGPSPYRHIWFSRVKELKSTEQGDQLVTTSGETFSARGHWLSNGRYQNDWSTYEVLVGLINDRQVCITTDEIQDIVFTTSKQEIDKFEQDVSRLLPLPSSPAVFHFQQANIPAERFFILDGGEEGGIVIFFFQWWPGSDFMIWSHTGSNPEEFWTFPSVTISKDLAKSIEFGDCPDLIHVNVELRNGTKIEGHWVTHTESHGGVWQWPWGTRGFWDSVVILTDNGLDVYNMWVNRCSYSDDQLPYPGALKQISFSDILSQE